MTADQFTRMLNTNYGTQLDWPVQMLVDPHTYAHCCEHVFREMMKRNLEEIFRKGRGDLGVIKVIIGDNGGLLFKNVELILKKE